MHARAYVGVNIKKWFCKEKYYIDGKLLLRRDNEKRERPEWKS
jgi:hypothetical protein